MADQLVAAKKVKINGKYAVVGQQVREDDEVELDAPVAEKIAKERVVICYHKPAGIVTIGAQKGEKNIADVFQYKTRVFPIGRLDKESHGLIVMTNDGRITDLLLNPKFYHEKEYEVRADRKLRPGFFKHAREGIRLENFTTKPAKAEKMSDTEFRITISEGRTHQIRRMCAAFNYAVRELKRVRVMNLKLGNLKPGQHRVVGGRELQIFLHSLGL